MAFRATIIALALALVGCASVPDQPVRPNIYVMRHLHTPAGVSDPDLTEQGRAAALALAAVLARDPPGAIYVSNTKRSRQTAAPTAQRFGIEPKVYDPADTAGLIARVEAEPVTVLVVGHSNTVPDIVERLGGPRPPAMTHEDFGGLWHIAGPERRTTRTSL